MNTRNSPAPPSPRRTPVLATLAVLLLTAPGRAAAPRDELLRLVPDDVAFCLVVQDLRDHARALGASPFARDFLASPLGTALAASGEVKKLAEVEAFLKEHLGVGWAGLRDDLLGDAFVLAFRSRPPGKADDDQGLFLLRARDARALADFVERLNRVQKDSGDLKEVETRRHGGVTYHRRAERKGDTFYSLDGPVLAFSSREDLLRQALEQGRRTAEAEPLVARELRSLGAGALATLWINPRAFDAEMERAALSAKPDEAAAHRTLARCWKALDGAALSLALEKDLRLTLSVRARPDGLPPAFRKLMAATGRPSVLWKCFPDDALLAAAGHVDASALLEALGELLAPEARAALTEGLERGVGAPAGKEFVAGMLPALGPDWGVCVTAPASATSWLPQAVVALRVRPGTGTPPADAATLSAITFYAQLAILAHNKSHKAPLGLRSDARGGVEVKYLSGEGAFPPGVRPSFALHAGFLILGTTSEAVRDLAVSLPLDGSNAAPGYPGEVPLLRVSVKAVRTFLEGRRELLAEASASKEGVTKDEAARRLDGILMVLRHIDRVEVTQAARDGRASLTLRVETAKPLR